MTNEYMGIGDIVRFTTEERAGHVGIVSQPISKTSAGQVLVYSAESILGVPAAKDDVKPAEKSTEGYAQLAYNLIKLGSHVIEWGLLEK
jgi:hypothetical protein